MKIAGALLLILGAVGVARSIAIHTIYVDLEYLVSQSEVIAIVSPTPLSRGAGEGSLEFDLVKVLYMDNPKFGVPKHLSVGPSRHGITFVKPPRRDPFGNEEAPVVYQYESPLRDEEIKRARQVIVFLNIERYEKVTHRFVVDGAVASMSRLADLQAILAQHKFPPQPAKRN